MQFPAPIAALLRRLEPWLLPIASFAAFVQLVGGGWDIQWHLERIPEVFWTPPHMVLYAGASAVIATTGAAFFLPWAGVRLARSRRIPIAFAFAGALLQVVAGGFDQWWHGKYGVDDALSPPHVLLTGAILLAALGILVSLSTMRRQEEAAGRARTVPWIAQAVAATCVGWALWGVLFVTLSPGFNVDEKLLEPFGWRLFVGGAFATTTPILVFAAGRFVRHRGAATLAAAVQVVGFLTIAGLMQSLEPLFVALSAIFLIPGVLVDVFYKPQRANAPYLAIALGAVVGQFSFLTGGIVDAMTFPASQPVAFAIAYVAGGVGAALIALALGDAADGLAAKDRGAAAAAA